MMGNRDNLDHSWRHAIHEAEREAWKDITSSAAGDPRPTLWRLSNASHGVFHFNDERLGHQWTSRFVPYLGCFDFLCRRRMEADLDVTHPGAAGAAT